MQHLWSGHKHVDKLGITRDSGMVLYRQHTFLLKSCFALSLFGFRDVA